MTLAAVTVSALLGETARGQEIVWQAVGRPDESELGADVPVLGDLDGDGYEELANIGRAAPPSHPSVIRIFSGRTGAVLRTRAPTLSNYLFLRIGPAGDWNGDGIRDYATTRSAFTWPYDPTFVDILSGRDDSVLRSVRSGQYTVNYGGENILSDLDTDGDGRPDLVVSVGREPPSGFLYVHANDGSMHYRIALNGPGGITNTRLGAVGDIDRDGCDDFGFWDYDPRYPGGAVRIASGRTGNVLYTVGGDVPWDNLGSGMIVSCGDIDGDGVPDFAASSHGHYPTNGIVRVFSGRNGATIYTWRKVFGQTGSAGGWGEALASGVDLDLDGIQDLVVGGCGFSCDQVRFVGERLYVYLLRTGREIEICTPDYPRLNSGTRFGFRVAAGRPHPGNPFPVFACGEYQYRVSRTVTTDQGRISLFRLPPSVVRPYGDPCFGTLAVAPQIGLLDLGPQGVRVHASNAPVGAPAVLLIGNSDRAFNGLPLPIKLSSLGFANCELRTSVQVTLATVTGSQSGARGYGFVDVPLPITGAGDRRRLYAQWVVLGQGPQAPGGLSAAVSWPY